MFRTMVKHFQAALALLLLSGGVSVAASLSVSPTKVEIAPDNAQTTMTIKSGGNGVSVVQLRIFRWKEGQDPTRLSETRDVAVSPPMARLNGRQELTVRIVRKSRREVRGRECYRVLVDRLPDQNRRRNEIGLRLRHSVPVCFTG